MAARTLIRVPVAWTGLRSLVEDAGVVAEGGALVYVGPAEAAPPADEEVAGDWFLMPGVVDRHVHIGLSDPGAVLTGGVTAVRDLGWPPDDIAAMAAASELPTFEGPLIRAVGPILTAPGGYPSAASWAPAGTALEVGRADDAEALVAGVLERSGTPVVKVALNGDAGPVLDDRTLVAVCEAAHRGDAIVTAHVQGPGQAGRAVGAGVDEFAHAPWSERLGDDLLGAMAGRVRIVSTLDIHGSGQDTRDLATATDNLRRFAAMGGAVAYGTDLGNGSIPPGIDVREALHLHRAGLDAEAVLSAMTFRPLAAGEPADLIGLAGSPLDDLTELGRLRFVMRGGRVARLGA